MQKETLPWNIHDLLVYGCYGIDIKDSKKRKEKKKVFSWRLSLDLHWYQNVVTLHTFDTSLRAKYRLGYVWSSCFELSKASLRGRYRSLSMLYLLLKKCKLCRIKDLFFLIHKVFSLQSFILGLFFKQASSNVTAFNGTNLWLGVSALIDLCEAVVVDRLVNC